MEFEATVNGERFLFSFINRSSVLVSGNCTEYILYKTSAWQCADEISWPLLEALGETIEQHQGLVH